MTTKAQNVTITVILFSCQHCVGVMPDTVKTQTHLSEFVHLLKKKPELQKLLSTAINPSTTRQDVIKTKVCHTYIDTLLAYPLLNITSVAG